MTAKGAAGAPQLDAGTLALGASLLAVTLWSWSAVLRGAHAPSMSAMMMTPSVAGGAAFVGQWGIMMAAMMLPSAAPMIVLYRTVRQRLAPSGERVIPALAFAAIYLVVWTVIGLPVYAGYVANSRLAMCCPSYGRLAAFGPAAVLLAAGAYQFTRLKRRCLSHCESPLSFLMGHWRNGYGASATLALEHSLYCVGCCWALMVILVVAGAMGIWWVAGIALVVFVEKLLPNGVRTARAVGAVLIVFGIGVAISAARQ